MALPARKGVGGGICPMAAPFSGKERSRGITRAVRNTESEASMHAVARAGVDPRDIMRDYEAMKKRAPAPFVPTVAVGPTLGRRIKRKLKRVRVELSRKMEIASPVLNVRNDLPAFCISENSSASATTARSSCSDFSQVSRKSLL